VALFGIIATIIIRTNSGDHEQRITATRLTKLEAES
jgi:hypothetical protein